MIFKIINILKVNNNLKLNGNFKNQIIVWKAAKKILEEHPTFFFSNAKQAPKSKVPKMPNNTLPIQLRPGTTAQTELSCFPNSALKR